MGRLDCSGALLSRAAALSAGAGPATQRARAYAALSKGRGLSMRQRWPLVSFWARVAFVLFSGASFRLGCSGRRGLVGARPPLVASTRGRDVSSQASVDVRLY